MAKITTDLAALDSAATTVTKVSDILTHWGYTPGSYTTWGDARTDANQLLTGTALGTIANGERGTTFVPKLNFLNDTAEVSKYGGAFVNGFRPEFGAFFDLDAYSVDNTPSTFSGAITHTRASTATYVDSNGVLQTAGVNVPRVGHHVWNGSAWVNEGLLHESEARTNSLPRNDFDGAVVGVIGSGGSAPTGMLLDNRLGSGAVTTVVGTGTEFGMPYIDVRWQGTATATPQTLVLRFNLPSSVLTSVGQTWTASAFARIVGGSYPSGVGETFRFNFVERLGATAETITVVNVDNPTEILSRFHGTYTLVDADADNLTADLELRVSTGAVVDITLRYYRPQLELGPTPSSVIPTSGSAVTRAADVLTIPSANLPWNPLAVSIQMDGRVTYADEGTNPTAQFWQWRLDANNYLEYRLKTDGANVGTIDVRSVSSGTFDNVQSAAYSPASLVPFNIASRHGSTFVNGAVDGTALTADTTPVALPDLSATNLQLGFDYMGTIKTFRVWANDIGDAGIAGATA